MTARLNRINRLPFILKRWKGRISLSILAKESEFATLAGVLTNYSSTRRLMFSVYITKTITKNNTPFYVQQNGKHLNYSEGFYPINTMRNLAIESISTTHCLVADVDMFPSNGLESSIDQYAEELCDHRNLVVVPTFQYKEHPSLKKCYKEGECADLCFMSGNYDSVGGQTSLETRVIS